MACASRIGCRCLNRHAVRSRFAGGVCVGCNVGDSRLRLEWEVRLPALTGDENLTNRKGGRVR